MYCDLRRTIPVHLPLQNPLQDKFKCKDVEYATGNFHLKLGLNHAFSDFKST